MHLLLQGLVMEVGYEGLTHEQRQTLKAIRERKGEVVAMHRSKKAVANNQAVLPRRADRERKSNTTNLKASLDTTCFLPWLSSFATQTNARTVHLQAI